MSGTLMISVSGVRGLVGVDLTPEIVARWAAAFGRLARRDLPGPVILGRDARTSGPMFSAAARAGLQSVGADVVDIGLVATPTLQLAVEHHRAAGGIMLTASHNPIEWNALKFVGSDGVFLDAERAANLRAAAEAGDVPRAGWDGLGVYRRDDEAVARHLRGVMSLPLLDVDRIRRRRLKVALDGVRGVGGIVVPPLLDALGCEVAGLDLEPDGRFPRAPEPIPEHLGGLTALVRQSGADIGMAVDPDGDRLALTDEAGVPIGEDYTLAFAVRAVLGQGPRAGDQSPVVVCNLSTSLVVDDAAREYAASVIRAPVGEAHVARAMLRAGAVIGGEGNGGVMLPALHVGRDAPVAAALVLELLARTGRSVAALVAASPRYAIVKAKAPRGAELGKTYRALQDRFPDAHPDTQDGLRLAWVGRWLHVRPSGTEPIVRLIAEAPSREEAETLVRGAREILERARAA